MDYGAVLPPSLMVFLLKQIQHFTPSLNIRQPDHQCSFILQGLASSSLFSPQRWNICLEGRHIGFALHLG